MKAEHAPLERYLTLASWGLWGQNKQTVRLELESHVRHKAWKYQVQGSNESDAIDRALEDLGKPQAISMGMNGVYMMPNLLRKLFLSSLLVSLGVTSFNSSAQVSTSNRVPIQECLNTSKASIKIGKTLFSCQDSTSLWVRWADLQKELEPQGVKFEASVNASQYRQITFPEGKTIYQSQGVTGYGFDGDSKSYSTSDQFTDLIGFISSLPQSQLPIHLEGWDNPRLEIGNTQLQLADLKGPRFYQSLLGNSISKAFKPKHYGPSYWAERLFRPDGQEWLHSFTVVDQPGRVYALLIAEEADPRYLRAGVYEGNVRSIAGVVTEAGKLEFPVLYYPSGSSPQNSTQKLSLASSYDTIKPFKAGRFSAVLVRVKTDLRDLSNLFEIIDPASVLVHKPERMISTNASPSSFCAAHGDIDLGLKGKWTGELKITTPQGQQTTGEIWNTMDANGVTRGTVTNDALRQTGNIIGTICKDGSTLSSYAYVYDRTLTSKGKVLKQSDGSLRGSSQEFENGKLIGTTEFVLRRQ